MPGDYNDIARKALETMNLKVEEDDENLEEEEEEEVEDEDIEEEDEETGEPDDDEEEEEEEDDEPSGDEEFEETPQRKPTAEEKKHHAFAELRVKNKELSTKISKLDELAKSYGFANHDDMLARLEEDKLRKEAAAKKVDPDYYVELRKTQRKVEELERLRKEEARAASLQRFVGELDTFSKEYELSEAERTQLVTKMEADGITPDDVIKWKNPRAVFKGYVEDKIVKRTEQRRLEKEAKRKRLKEERHSDTAEPSNVTMDALVKHVLAQRKNNY